MPRRRVTPVFLLIGVCVTILLIFSSTSSKPREISPDTSEQPSIFKGSIPTFEIPSFQFSFKKSSHKPPEQKNSTGSGSSWYSDYQWLNPFSSSVTLDEDRAVLPPLSERPPVYTYYESISKKNKSTLEADQELLVSWQRAWWAKGFRPVILSEAEAMNNPLYQTMQQKDISKALEFEVSRWLAWGHMGSGLLSSWRCFPMAAYDDPLLSYLRRGQYERLTGFEGLGAGLFAGQKDEINNAMKNMLGDLKLNTFKSVVDGIGSGLLNIETTTSIAHYDSATIEKKYPALASTLADDPASGLLALNELINAHLHTVWQNSFPKGIAVLKPLPAHTTELVEPALHLAKLLAECPDSIIQSSCPPNKAKCAPCVSSRIAISTPNTFRNTTALFTIGTVPHPYTMAMLNNQSESLSVAHIRRYTDRDPWVTAVTTGILGTGRGGPSRILALKDAIASDQGRSSSLWFTVEQFPATLMKTPPAPKSPTNEAHPQVEMLSPFPENWLENLDWHFGFPIPRNKLSHGESFPPVPGPERWSNSPAGLPAERKKSWDPDPPTAEESALEIRLLQKAREIIRSSDVRVTRLMKVAEAWNLADTEVWKFVKAFRARDIVERNQWREEESHFSDTGAGKGNSRWW